MPLTPERASELIANGESQRVEFKTATPAEGDIARVLAAFANTEGGILFVGVSDHGEVCGLTPAEAHRAMDRLRRVAASLIPIPADVGVLRVLDRVVAYAAVDPVPSHLRPVLTSEGRVFARKADMVVAVDFGTSSTSAALLGAHRRSVVVFVAMSFNEEEEPALVDYFRAMERAVQFTGLPIDIRRIDLEEGDYEISQRVMEAIDVSDIVIADLTLNSRNVYFEVGYARGTGKRIIQTARTDSALEFDVRNWRTLFYRNATELEEKLIEEIKVAYNEASNRRS
jgi:nucleoside 2-deoxyribosyltransferase